jgi:putative ABC transport system permease protein
VTAIAAAIGAALSTVLTFIFAQPVVVPASAYAALPVVAIVVGLLASLGAVRRTVRADPASAFS